MNVSSIGISSYAAMLSASAKNSPAGTAIPSATTKSTGMATVVTLSDKALQLMRARQVSDETTGQFKDILAKANSSDVQSNPKAFLNSLSSAELEALRKVHGLADRIDVSNLTDEGAVNLLAAPGSARDLDNNGLTNIGAGNTFTFPPENAPESFKAAWTAATDGMSNLEIPTHMIFAVGLANIRYDEGSGRVVSTEPGDPDWRNPYANPDYDYKDAVSKIMSQLEDARGIIPQERYRHDMEFYTRLTEAMS